MRFKIHRKSFVFLVVVESQLFGSISSVVNTVKICKYLSNVFSFEVVVQTARELLNWIWEAYLDTATQFAEALRNLQWKTATEKENWIQILTLMWLNSPRQARRNLKIPLLIFIFILWNMHKAAFCHVKRLSTSIVFFSHNGSWLRLIFHTRQT